MNEYADLEIIIQEAPDARRSHAYPVAAFYGNQPRASATLTLNPTARPWPDWQKRLANVLDEPGSAFLHEVGWALYQALFTGEVEQLWTIAQADLEAKRVVGIRIRLAIDPPAIAALPWELLYDERSDRSIACRARHPLVRVVGRIGQVPPRRAMPLSLPLRVLFIAPGRTGLNWRRELEITQDALQRLGSQVELRTLVEKATFTDLSDLLGDWQPHILHFATHGKFDGTHGYLMFTAAPDEHPSGDSLTWIRSDQLRTLLDARGESVRLIVLSACQGAQTSPESLSRGEMLAGLGPALIQAGVPAVIGMQFEIRDEAAIIFTRALYRGLLEPRRMGQVDAAVAEARAELEARWPDQQAYATPVLFLNAEHGRIFSLVGEVSEMFVSPKQLEATQREHLRRQLVRDLRERRRALMERVRQRRGHLDMLRQQAAAYPPAERPIYLQSQIQAVEQELAEEEGELKALDELVAHMEEAGAPEEVSPEEFERGALPDAIIEAAVEAQPYEQAFSAEDVTHWLQTTYPSYWERLIRRAGSPTAIEQAIYRRLTAMAQQGTGRLDRRWFLIQSGDRFKRSRY
ncbi:MAG TPA: CHAT domain-containing protein [Caldilineae bacterium]|nr:CHAT domain-containing protein [Caldilineae bacterium]